MPSYADTFFQIKKSKFMWVYWPNRKCLYVLPVDEGYKKEGYSGAAEKLLSVDFMNVNEFKQMNIIPPQMIIEELVWDSDRVDNDDILKSLLPSFDIDTTKDLHIYPSGLSFYCSVKLNKPLTFTFNNLTIPTLSEKVSKWLESNKKEFNYIKEGFFNPEMKYHGFDERFSNELQKPARIISILNKNNTDDEKYYCNNSNYFNTSESFKVMEDILKRGKKIQKSLEQMGMQTYLSLSYGHIMILTYPK